MKEHASKDRLPSERRGEKEEASAGMSGNRSQRLNRQILNSFGLLSVKLKACIFLLCNFVKIHSQSAGQRRWNLCRCVIFKQEKRRGIKKEQIGNSVSAADPVKACK